MTIAERVVCLVVIASCGRSWQHAHPLLLERVLVLCFDRVIYNRLEHLDDEEKEDMGATQQLAVFAVRLTVTYKHPEALHDFALDDVARRVAIELVPDAL